MIRVSDLNPAQPIHKVIVLALAPMLYQIIIEDELGEHLVYTDEHTPYRTTCIEKVKELFESYRVESMVLRQQSAYDEMIGHPSKQSDNTLEVMLSPTRAGY
ncbi:DUF6482 family protein [Pontibacterium granulatum]|uniref:DUF6482 family protein n=1 Tax=Pontibacterium granulatum TaxID=2036029 RepID=UPI00249A7951|nr:DUF6482 family protein [Pontibacterium granulatum]MDI3325621.1 DUF6482 family protein [Pontibacterium granulatum]